MHKAISAVNIFMLAAAFVLFPREASAYIDPTAGNYILQLILAALASVIVFGRSMWIKINSFFIKDRKDDNEGDNEADPSRRKDNDEL
jgi:hypothetical protein